MACGTFSFWKNQSGCVYLSGDSDAAPTTATLHGCADFMIVRRSKTVGRVMRCLRETVAAVRHPELQKRFADLGAEPVGSSPAEQDAILKRQIEQFRPIIQTMHLD